jgi:taurine--2-oxoglutarate transaminase
MDGREMIDLCLRHTLYDWSASGQVDPLTIVRAEGVWFWDADGNRYLDFNSQLMSVHVGHGHPKVIGAMKAQLDRLVYAWPGSATEPRARLGQRLAALLPGDINTFFFTLGGAEANENALRAARLYTGRHKVLSRYRSYHGATFATMQLTGDPRRIANESGATGFVRVLDPVPYEFSFGTTPEEITRRNLEYVEEVILAEGAETIAAMFIETVTGTNGILPPPPGYLRGLKALLKRHGILLVCDEVMSGFGRTGKMFAFEHDGIVPDIVTMAKGITSSYIPLGAVGLSDPIARHFDDHVWWGGLTYNSHPLALATALAVLDVIEDEGLVDHAARLGGVMHEEMERLRSHHPSVRATRNLGLFGIIELQRDMSGTPLVPWRGKHPAFPALRRDLLARGLFTLFWNTGFFCNPPLSITEEELRAGFRILDDALATTDLVVENGTPET